MNLAAGRVFLRGELLPLPDVSVSALGEDVQTVLVLARRRSGEPCGGRVAGSHYALWE